MISLATRPIWWLLVGLWRLIRSDSVLFAGVLACQFPAALTLWMYRPGTAEPAMELENEVRFTLLGLYALTFVLALVKMRWLLLLFGLAGGHGLAVLFGLTLSGREELAGSLTPEMIAWSGRVSLAYFVLRGRIRSPEYFIAIGVLFAVAPISTALMFAGATLVLRFIFLIVWQNFTILLDIGLTRAAFLSVKTLVYWAPILLFMVPSVLITNYIHDATMTSIYENGILTDTGSGDDGKVDVEADMHARVGKEFDTARGSVDAKLDKLKADIKEDLNVVPSEVLRVYYEVVPPANQIPGLARSEADCFLLDVPCWILHEIIESIKGGIRSSYNHTRERQGLKLYYETKTKVEGTTAGSDEFIEEVKADMHRTLDDAEESTKDSISAVFRAIDIAKVVSNIALLMVAIRSYLYVFARVTFTKRSRASISLRPKGKNPRHGSVKKWGKEFGIDASCPEDFYVSRRFEPNGRAPNFIVPQPFAGILRRVRSGSYTMNRIRFGEGRGSVYFTAVRGAEFVSWNLEEGETVVFDYKNFVAMSKGVTLSSEVSFRVSSLIFGRIVFPTATGPGTIVLQSKGNPTIGTEKRSSASVPPSRILAWHDHTRFTVESELNMIDIYMSAVYLERVGQAPVVIDADTMSSPVAGLARFIRYFILPT